MKTKITAFILVVLMLAAVCCPAYALSFTDVSPNAWYQEAVNYVSDNGLMAGTGNSRFEPDTTMDRAMFVTTLYRIDGSPQVSGSAPFSDVAAGSYYADAVAWARENGVVSGVGNNRFAPREPLSRQQLATMLYQYAEYKGYPTVASDSLAAFPDAAQVSGYAAAPMRWAVGAGIIAGSNGRLLPNTAASRAQAAQMLMRFRENIVLPNQSGTNPTDPTPSPAPSVTPSPSPVPTPPVEPAERRMKITVGGTTLYAKLADNATADAIAEKLPLTLPMMDLYGREMCYRFDEALPATDVQTRNFQLGEIIYWPPRHSFVIMYHQDGEVFSMQHVGQIESGVEIFEETGDVTATFELVD